MRFEDIAFRGAVRWDPVRGLWVVASFDVTDMLMRAVGQDPYAYEKLKLLDSTREERARLRLKHRRVVMQRALDQLPAYVNTIWSRSEIPVATRRRVLFELWEEAAERGSPDEVAGGAQARRTIEMFVVDKLPPGSRDAFTAQELAAFNRTRDCLTAFLPYGADEEDTLLASVRTALRL
jgi:hypothetical protein